MPSSKDVFLSLVRMGIGHTAEPFPNQMNWSEIKALADRQGLSAIVLDGLDQLPNENRPPKDIALPWIGEVVNNYENRYRRYCEAIASLAGFYNGQGIKMMVLKGYACSLDWPKPNHRPCGDIDLWLFGKYREADEIMTRECGIQIDSSHYHHTVFDWLGFMVENHYDFIDISTRGSSRELELVLKDLGKDASYAVELNKAIINLPSPNLNALFLIRHMVDHFTSVSINLRQLLDWAFFVKRYSNEIDWAWLSSLLEKFHIKDFYNCLNAICVVDLGFSNSIFPPLQYDSLLKEKVLKDILYPEFTAEEPRGFIKKMFYKYRRWQGNAWKQELCYPERRFSVFFLSLKTHLIKPQLK